MQGCRYQIKTAITVGVVIFRVMSGSWKAVAHWHMARRKIAAIGRFEAEKRKPL